MKLKWFRRFNKWGTEELSIELPEQQKFWLDRDVEERVIRIVAEQLVDKYGDEVVRSIDPKQIKEALETTLIKRSLGSDGSSTWRSK